MKNKRLKLFILGPAYPLRGGPAQFNENLCAELNKEGHDAQIISYSLQYPNFLFPGSSQFETSGSAPTGIKIHTLINTVNPFNWIKVASFIKKEKPDFILIRYWLPFFGPSLGAIARLVRSKTKVLALTDNIIPHEKRIGDKAFTNYFVNSCHGFIAMSKTVLNDISKFSKTEKKAYSPHPMYETYGPIVSKKEAREKLQLNQDDKIILFFGLIRHYKGLDILIEAMTDPEIKKLNIKLLIAGEFYEDKQPYLDLIEKFELKNHVLLHDKFIANEDVRYYFCASNLVAQTYRKATNSGVTMVGYYYEKPMLVTNVGGLAEIVPNNSCGYVVENSVPVISEKIKEYFLKEKENEFTQNVILEKKKYEWKEFIRVLTGLFESTKKNIQ
ncbi:glycosyltransferase [Aurantibacillus circumpalustris]|uniref:glycosyltransferase n=1 Tax=Aurantibacillus circumpalustris TaxID=3036359 RepID=UPI00295B3429|nr:glycosyltransferase [Aurantibacillus circumpalustris]